MMDTLFGSSVVSFEEMKRVEELSFNQGAKPLIYVETAGKNLARLVEDISEKYSKEKKVVLVAGKGNNAADGYALSINLLAKGYKVEAFSLFSKEDLSPLCGQMLDFFEKNKGKVTFVKSPLELIFPKKGILIDAIFGIGFAGKSESLVYAAIERINASPLFTVSIDVPSGIDANGYVRGNAVKAAVTACLGPAKLPLFINDGWNYAGSVVCIDFGMPETYRKELISSYYLLSEKNVFSSLPKIVRRRNKYSRGVVVGIAGSLGMCGAAKLAAKASLRTGAGLVKLFYPEDARDCQQGLLEEVISFPFRYDSFENLLKAFDRVDALFIGPGLGRTKEVTLFLQNLFLHLPDTPKVLDADALYFLAGQNEKLPLKNAILTPHRKEMSRLLQLEDTIDDRKFHELVQGFVNKNNCHLILKGAPTFIFFPNHPPLVIPRGSPGMATAGTGDVLTGMVAALLAQKVSLQASAILGAYLHALSGELAAREKTDYSMIASDLTEKIPSAFKMITDGQNMDLSV